MKKFLAVITALSILLCYTAICTSAKTAYKIGDVDTDKTVTISDATAIQLFVADLYPFSNVSKKLADVDNDNSVTVMDSTMIQMFLAKLINDFPANSEEPTQGDIAQDGYYDQILKP